ncbi:Roquin-1 [Frankliniella fusca]|uniref:RING-type E3 ubiquitin transferase n=1 Tax=Frankliniella fusca TaxID=407009 RepID=A0AAE1I4H8_9NEOP|nr:Roquin-1 [Frankliniella fusca]
MPIQAPQWTEFLSCPVCTNEFAPALRSPISLGCGHTVCRTCLNNLHCKQCPFDQATINTDLEELPVNYALLQLVLLNGLQDANEELQDYVPNNLLPEDSRLYLQSKKCIEELALYLKPFSTGNGGGGTSFLSRPMQRKLVTLINCQLMEAEGRARALRAARSLGERTVMELILQHQNPQQLSANLWAAVRARGCQFLGPAMQEEVLKLVLLALEDGSALSRKVLVMFVVQRLEQHFPQASKTSIGHVVQLLYRASCFKVSKREGDSSLMQLKDEFRTYEALRREHDAQIVQIATEAGLRIAPDQWSALLYGDTVHKSQMQSIIDKLQSPQSFSQSVHELIIALQRTGDPGKLSVLRSHLELLAEIDPSPECEAPSWNDLWHALDGVRAVVAGLVEFIQLHGSRKLTDQNGQHGAKYKISMCRDLTLRSSCPRGANCTFAHTEEELDRYRAKNRKNAVRLMKMSNDIKEEREDGDGIASGEETVYGSPPLEACSIRKGFMASGSQAVPNLNYRPVINMATSRPDVDFNVPFSGGAGVAPPSQLLTPTQTTLQQMSPVQVTAFRPMQPAVFAQPPVFHPDIYSQSPHASMLGVHSGQQFKAISMQNVDYTSPPSPLPMENARNASKMETLHHQKQVHPRIIQTTPAKVMSSRELFMLQQRKNKIVSQLEKVVGKHLANAISSQVRVSHIISLYFQSRSNSVQTDDEVVPHEGPVMSKYGPISRMTKTLIQSGNPYAESSIPGSVSRRPLTPSSSMASMLLHNLPGYPSSSHILTTQAPAGSDGYITIGHSILDSTQFIMPEDKQQLESQLMHLHMRNLEQGIHNLKLDPETHCMQESEKLTSELFAIEQGIREQIRMSQPMNSPDMSSWNKEGGNLSWNVRPPGNIHVQGEDSYDAVIANDMMEQALRLELDLEEQEKRWCNEDGTAKP